MEKFAQVYVTTGRASTAYRAAYSTENMKASTVHRRAFELIRHGKITARIRELRAALSEATAIDLSALVLQLQAEREMALEQGEPQHATRATLGMADLLGLTKKRLAHEFPDLPPLSPREFAELRAEADAEL